MCHQIRFFLTSNDTLEVEQKLLTIEESQILHSRSRGPHPRTVESSDLVENGRRWLFFCLARRVDLDRIVNEEVITQGYWSINTLKSPVVEFTRSPFEGQVLKTGRLYYNESYYDGSTNLLVQKSESFLKWAKKVLSAAKHTLNYDKSLEAYLGKEAMKMRKSGIEFQQF